MSLKLYTAAQSKEIDRIAIEDLNINGYELMERAGQAACELFRQQWPEANNVLIVCGSGNNGGDGFVLARLLHNLGLVVDVYCLAEAERISGDAKLALDDAVLAGIKPNTMNGAVSEGFIQSLALCSVVVDAVLGTGTKGEIKAKVAELIATINASSKPVLALDIPSGLCADTGVSLGETVRANQTVSFIALKQGLYTGQAADFVGTVSLDKLGVPEEAFAKLKPRSSTRLISYETERQVLAPRRRACHKGSFGHVLLIGGNRGMGGAIALAAEAALRCGAGLASVGTHPDNAAMVTTRRPEIMSSGISDPKQLDSLISKASVIVLGPGLGLEAWSRSLFDYIMSHAGAADLPMVMDADALVLLAELSDSNLSVCLSARKKGWVLTPHPGEAARLLGIENQKVNRSRFNALQELRTRFLGKQVSGSVVLKGAGSLIATDEGCSISTDGNPGMASGGMGDVLSGIVAALIAQHLSCQKAAELGVCLHGHAADLVAGEQGERGLLASDLLKVLPRLVN